MLSKKKKKPAIGGGGRVLRVTGHRGGSAQSICVGNLKDEGLFSQTFTFSTRRDEGKKGQGRDREREKTIEGERRRRGETQVISPPPYRKKKQDAKKTFLLHAEGDQEVNREEKTKAGEGRKEKEMLRIIHLITQVEKD